jgi:hypothetical protein
MRSADPVSTLSTLIDEIERFYSLVEAERETLISEGAAGGARQLRQRSERIQDGAAQVSATAREAIGALRGTAHTA